MQSAKQTAFAELRQFGRTEIHLPGKIFVPAEETTIACDVVNLSGGGASIQCVDPPPLQTFIVLYIEGFGRFEGVTTRYVEGSLGLRFVCKEAKRERLLRDLAAFVVTGKTTPSHLRRHRRNPSGSNGHYTRSGGERVPYEVIDLSVQGVSLKTSVQPPLGEVVQLGHSYGRVIRHHPDGVALQFVAVAD